MGEMWVRCSQLEQEYIFLYVNVLHYWVEWVE